MKRALIGSEVKTLHANCSVFFDRMTQANTSVITSEQVQKTLVEVITNNIQRCNNDTQINTGIEIKGDGNIISNLVSKVEFEGNVSCFTSTKNQTKLATDLASKLANEANAKADTFFGLFAGNTSVIDATSVQDIVQRNMTNNISTCSQNFGIDNKVVIEGNYNQVLDSTLAVQGSQFAQCVFGTDNMADISSKIASEMNNKATSQTSSAGFIAIIVILVVAAVAVGIVYKFMKSPNAGATPKITGDESTAVSEGASETARSMFGSLTDAFSRSPKGKALNVAASP
jgi:hypothetical protein